MAYSTGEVSAFSELSYKPFNRDRKSSVYTETPGHPR